MNYSWMPELTIRMAHHLIQQLPIRSAETVLDYGCAKGFLVRALRILDIDAHGACHLSV
jgi:cyclopropane fatty-acyl-phospholipid synthase-like methyltransferase